MNANELMIGDWVEFTSKYDCGTGQIAAIEPMEGTADPTTFSIIKNKQDGSHFYVGVSKNGVRPIPLTAEILEKNGFKKDTGGEECWANSKGWFTPHEYGKRDTIKSWEVEICGKINSFDGVIKYIHELQHALCLCGIEKEIVL